MEEYVSIYDLHVLAGAEYNVPDEGYTGRRRNGRQLQDLLTRAGNPHRRYLRRYADFRVHH